MYYKKIDAMHRLFGKKEMYRCKDCRAFERYRYRGKLYRKCIIYGITNSEASDWNASYIACGLAPEGHFEGEKIIKTDRRKAEQNTMEGQMEL